MYNNNVVLSIVWEVETAIFPLLLTDFNWKILDIIYFNYDLYMDITFM